MRTLAWVMMAAAAWTSSTAAKEYRALVYRGPAVCKTCPRVLAQLLESSPSKFTVTYAGPNEDVKITAESLRDVDVFAYGGGPDLDDAWKEIQDSAPAIRNFVSQGGHYIGVCLGAFLAGYSPGLGILPPGADVDSEISQSNSQVTNSTDTLIQVDWTFQSAVDGHTKGQTIRDRWAYFQDGVVIKGLSADAAPDAVLARYSQSGNVAASRTPHGNGSVVLVGIHPEATSQWYNRYNLTNPDGIQFDIGYDLVNVALYATPGNRTQESGASRGGRAAPHHPFMLGLALHTVSMAGLGRWLLDQVGQLVSW